ncbi:MAG TPA: tetratricopeptide repeat protein [Gemmatimonadales bacterium]|nr:tetratricopeptide repeat protein [Gemmatimonadales bacterium]
MNLDKLKDTARRHELREEWRKAIEIYQRALQDVAKGGEPADPSLYNRIGDLELKAGESGAAVIAYEQAADTYTEQGFFNNAIALCGKILRVNPGRSATFLRLADLHARKNVLGESRRNLSEYVERMLAASQHEQLTPALKGFVERFAGGAEYRTMIAEVLRTSGKTEKARIYCDTMIAELGLEDESAHVRPRGDDDGGGSGPAGLVFLDTGIDIPGIQMGGPAPTAGPVTSRDSGAAPEPDSFAVAMEVEVTPDAAPLPFLEPTSLGGLDDPDSFTIIHSSGFEPTGLVETLIPEPNESLVVEDQPETLTITGLEALPAFAPPVTGELGFEPMPLNDDLVPDLNVPVIDEPSIDEPPIDDPIEPGLEPLFDELSVEDEERKLGAGASVGELDMALENAIADSRWDEATKFLLRLIRLEPDVVSRHQKRVEIAYRSGNREYLVDAYISLAQALERIGATENAGLVFERVLEHDPENPVALAGLAGLGVAQRGAPPEPAEEAETAPTVPTDSTAKAEEPRQPDSFVDLGALILDPEPEKDTRMRVDQGEPESEEDVDFRETLDQFMQGVNANIDAADFQAHYDLGIAFKEMGLLDEAIAQFQKALRAPDGRLRASEALGGAFFEKGRFAIAEAVLSRAVETLPEADDAKIALIYWWGRALEAQGKIEAAVRCFERALAVDITFLDLGDRLQRLNSESGK